jgi:hypothetical protein
MALQDAFLAKMGDGMKVEIERPSGEKTLLAKNPNDPLEELLILAPANSVGVGGQRRGLGKGIEPGKKGGSRVVNEIHDVADPLAPHELQREKGKEIVESRDHLASRQSHSPHQIRKIHPGDQGQEEEESSYLGSVAAGSEGELSPIRDLGGFWLGPLGPLVIEAAGQAGKSRLAKDLPDRPDAQGSMFLGEDPADVIDGVVLLAQLEDAGTGLVLLGLMLGTGLGGSKEGLKLALTEAGALDVEGAGSIAKALGDLGDGDPVDKEGAKGFVETMRVRDGTLEVLFPRARHIILTSLLILTYPTLLRQGSQGELRAIQGRKHPIFPLGCRIQSRYTDISVDYLRSYSFWQSGWKWGLEAVNVAYEGLAPTGDISRRANLALTKIEANWVIWPNTKTHAVAIHTATVE